MTRLFNDPDDFGAEMTAGFAAASARWVRAHPGGVVRSTADAEPTVSLVVGGGSGHYPAFAGLVGPGLAHGAAMGNIFASPSTQQVHSVAAEADQGRGVLLSYGNYAGDVLNFDAAQERLRADGVDCRTVVVTDDVSSATADRRADRRGIAGDLTVFKVAGAACAAGYDLDGVERVARLTNDRTRSLGVAFDGCTLPGADEPLFRVPENRMAVGLGIHGEPGIDETDVPTAAALAELLVSTLLAEIPDGAGTRVVPILNGLGSVKYEELFVVYGTVHRLLAETGLEIVDPEVGEFCTSFDMAGASLTLLWPDDELERLWTAPCDTPAFRRGRVDGQRTRSAATGTAPATAAAVIGDATPRSRACGARIAAALADVAGELDAHAEEFGRLDRVAGDGDHGIGMQRGGRAARDAAADAAGRGAGAGTVLRRAADAWGDRAGGTSGAIWAAALDALGGALGDDTAPDTRAVADAVRAAEQAVTKAGGATVGDKTMVDAIVPFVRTLDERTVAGDTLADAWDTAARAATDAAEGTRELRAGLGRARSHGDRSIGTPDPGAVSFALVVRTVGQRLREEPTC
ncbi:MULTISPECIES: dihydroxyacetone kinase family protein [Pseudonocardia]|uniref:PTS-dependent dihydroxyacetone kinase, dihydroxyacetone-binding subunit DhaK n=2 Tax=Pseudonocardia TaxID=1847 RepID=A0A1Y2N2N3_PSEAH|nr:MULTISPECIES: dihydroxyacetone kinase family protein [Pseudonocardia]OSY41429.1 PTS-dependent dihydroxyacetone kinase, dihydroxyacetone-binding subunit DhaK [Pseudonocardia autotrophica]TDN71386.1 homodimeric dihydroxyacetone kinase [Pseudonocardia autotrophica]BBG02062.1 erythrulose kinase [Pseudonocardia autotrophica]GEC24076.1 erythrulose kinase [Pseudonocardia saturnea]